MGSWGTGIFQDDFASDLRDRFTELAALRFADEAIFAELQREFGRTEGIEESTFWIALALVQHKFGRLDDGVKTRALHLIDSGRALQDWADLAGPGDPSIPSRNRQLLQARAAIVSVPPKRKTPRPSRELLERIDRTYSSSFPWKDGGIYAYRLSSGGYAVLAVVRLLPIALSQHYRRRGNEFVPVSTPDLVQPFLLLLDYRKPHLPSKRELAAMQPFVKPIQAKDRKEWLQVIDETREMHRAAAGQTFAGFERENRDNHRGKTDEEFRQHFDWWVGWSRTQRDFYSDREHALQRRFYSLLMIDARQTVPVDNLVDLAVERRFDHENECICTSWEALDKHLVSGKPLDASHICNLWPVT